MFIKAIQNFSLYFGFYSSLLSKNFLKIYPVER